MNRPQTLPQTPAPRPGSESRLRVVPAERARPVRLRRIGILVVVGLLAGLFVVGVMQAVVTEAQGRIDQLNAQITEATATDRELRLDRVRMLSPAALRDAARDRLGMVTPTTIVYLVPSEPPAP